MISRFFTRKMVSKTQAENTYQLAKNAAIHALETLGNGHSEKTYECVIQNYLYDRRVPTKRQARYFTKVDENMIETGILDIEVNHSVLLELKVGHDTINNDHKVQLRRYLRSARQNKPYDVLIAAVFLFSKKGTLIIHKVTDSPTDNRVK
jgi:GxxExxY protein